MWVITAAGCIVNLQHVAKIKVHSNESLTGKHEVRAWYPPHPGFDTDYEILFSHAEVDVCRQKVLDYYFTLQPPKDPQVLDRAPDKPK